MPIGKMRERVAFEKRADISDGYGNTVSDFAEQFVTWARVRPLIGGETIQASRLQGEQPFVITIHMSDNARLITPDWRARNDRSGTLYNIRSVANNDEKNAYLDITAVAGEATG